MKNRLFFLDNIRTFLTMLLIIFHTAIAYGASGSWILDDVDKSEINATIVLLTIFTGVCQAFFMGLFFLISSYFFPTSYERKGAFQFLKGRLVRLGIPLLIYYFVIGPMTVWYAKFRDQQTMVQFYKDNVWSFRWTFFGPAWFLEASIYFTLLYILFRLLTKDRITKKSIVFPNSKTLVTVAIALGLSAFAVRLVYPTGTGPLELQLGYFPSYILLFIAGIIAQRQGWLEQIPGKIERLWKWVALIGVVPVLPLGLILTGALDGDVHFDGGFNMQALFYAMWEPFICLGIIIFLLSYFHRRFNTMNAFSKWLSDNAYTVYLIHPPVVVGWTIAFHGVGVPAIIKWIMVSALSIAVCFIVASAIRMLPYAKRVF
ncbi:acyltransferase family protein [Paenibacillus sp. PR3]|uniref:Acyltransferase family protein n=1 Tax=Paenibacillus terricola TaxID=2763503 RepID=A0ABR8N7A3_9BACL|nr:acyltransferase family protein [Paenibacillus terricola]MBD3922724.1 acyltransferase family protein [Paenibacillus terricola]